MVTPGGGHRAGSHLRQLVMKGCYSGQFSRYGGGGDKPDSHPHSNLNIQLSQIDSLEKAIYMDNLCASVNPRF